MGTHGAIFDDILLIHVPIESNSKFGAMSFGETPYAEYVTFDKRVTCMLGKTPP